MEQAPTHINFKKRHSFKINLFNQFNYLQKSLSLTAKGFFDAQNEVKKVV